MKSIVRKVRKGLSKKKHRRRLAKHGSDAIKSLKLALDESGLRYWIEFGTLLGAVRDGGFIGHDLDIDLAVAYGESLPDLDRVFEHHGFRLKSFFEHEGKLLEKTYVHDKKVEVDIFVAYEVDDKFIVYDCVWDKDPDINRQEVRNTLGGSPCYENRMSHFGLQPYEFLGVSLYAPDNIEQHLTELYGEGYMTPDPNWKHSTRKIRKSAGFSVKRRRA